MRAQSVSDVLSGKNNKEAYDSDKALAVLTRILILLGGEGDKHQLIKMMYWIERSHIIETGFPIFYDQVYSLHYGPILSQTLDNLNSCYLETAPWYGNIAISSDHRIIRLIKEGDFDLLSRYDERMAAETVNKFKDLNFNDRTDYFHQLPEYTNVPEGERQDISYRVILEKCGNIPASDLEEALLEIESIKLEK